MAASSKSNARSVRVALAAGTNIKEKGPPVADGILTATPETPDNFEWRGRSSLDVAETSSTYLDEDDRGSKPHELYGKFTWKIENFSEINKRELRSSVFDVGNYKWYILVYPQGCEVCNHLSLFLCVADYDKLLPGWSHFAQFTIAVVNKDPKKSKYSDTLHRFCKKEHDWGWKKFMLSKVLDGFTLADTLVIKVQVQVILDKPSKPFRCLDLQYRQELVRVYMANVEGVCRRFCEEKRERLAWVREEAPKFRAFWEGLEPNTQRGLLMERGELILKGAVKQFFNEKEVTSTLMMDALYSGCRQLEEHSRQFMAGTCAEAPLVIIQSACNTLTLHGDVEEIAERMTDELIPAANDGLKPAGDGLAMRSGQDGDARRDTIEQDERRLSELGRRTVEMFVVVHIFTEKLEVAYREVEALRRQNQLIAEEAEAAAAEDTRRREQAERDRGRRAKKKERLKVKREAEQARREAEEAVRVLHEAARRAEAKRRAHEAAAAERERLEEASVAMQQQAAVRQALARMATAPPRASPRPSAPVQWQLQQPASAQCSRRQQAQTPPTGNQQGESQPFESSSSSAPSLPCCNQPPIPCQWTLASSNTHAPSNAPHYPTALPQGGSSSSSSRDMSPPCTSAPIPHPHASARSHDMPQGAGAMWQGRRGGTSASTGSSSGGSGSWGGSRQSELEEENGALRARVQHLEQVLEERDTEIHILRDALELQAQEVAREAALAVAARLEAESAVMAQVQVQAQHAFKSLSAPSAPTSSCHTATSSMDREMLGELASQAACALDSCKPFEAHSNRSSSGGAVLQPYEGPCAAAGLTPARQCHACQAGTSVCAAVPHTNGTAHRRSSGAGSQTCGAGLGAGCAIAATAGPAPIRPGLTGDPRPAGFSSAFNTAPGARGSDHMRVSSLPRSATSTTARPTASTSAPQQLAQAAAAAVLATGVASGSTAASGGGDRGQACYHMAAAGAMGRVQAPAAGAGHFRTPNKSHKLGGRIGGGVGSSSHPNLGGQEHSKQQVVMKQMAATQQVQGQHGLAFTPVGGKCGAGALGRIQAMATPTQLLNGAPPSPHQDSPGLDDFAHMGLIDDLLGTE